MNQLFCNVDGNGNLTQSYIGQNIIATDPYDFFFLIDDEIRDSINDYKVTMQGFKASLVLK